VEFIQQEGCSMNEERLEQAVRKLENANCMVKWLEGREYLYSASEQNEILDRYFKALAQAERVRDQIAHGVIEEEE